MSSQLPIVQIRRGTKTQWETVGIDIVPLDGEVVLEQSETTPRLKVGDGKRTYGELPYITSNAEAAEVLWQTLVGCPQLAKGEGDGAIVGNDLATNKALGTKAVAFGEGTVAGCRGFNILAIEPAGYDSTETAPTEMHLTLDSVEGLAVDDSCSVAINKNYMEMGKITNISENTITINAYPDDLTAAIISTTVVGGGEKLAYVFVSTKQTIGTTIFGSAQHAEGYETAALMVASHAEGAATVASGKYSHAEGDSTFAGYAAHAEGQRTSALGGVSHAEGGDTIASGKHSHAEGQLSTASGSHSHAEGYETAAEGHRAHSEGYKTSATGEDSHSEGSISKATGAQSHAEGQGTVASAWVAHAEGYKTQATKNKAHAEGGNTTASGETAHAEGHSTVASGYASHAEGYSSDPTNDKLTQATARGAHAEGTDTLASGIGAHAEGGNTVAQGEKSHAEGFGSKAYGLYAHAEGYDSIADGQAAHAEGKDARAIGSYSHAEGLNGIAHGHFAHAEGYFTTAGKTDKAADSRGAHAEGYNTTATGLGAHAEGNHSSANGDGAHAEGSGTANGIGAHAEGSGTYASKSQSHAEGQDTRAQGWCAHAEGYDTWATANKTHTEGGGTQAYGECAHAEGQSTWANGCYSHAEGQGTVAGDKQSPAQNTVALGAHAEGRYTIASGQAAHAEGNSTVASGAHSHTEGTNSQATAPRTHAEGWGTIASVDSQHVQGKFNEEDNTAAHIVGWGTSDSDRKNIHTLSTQGGAWFAEDVRVGGDSYDTGNTLATTQYVDEGLYPIKEDVELLKDLSAGVLYDSVTVESMTNPVTVPSNALPAATIDKIGTGIKTEVINEAITNTNPSEVTGGLSATCIAEGVYRLNGTFDYEPLRATFTLTTPIDTSEGETIYVSAELLSGSIVDRDGNPSSVTIGIQSIGEYWWVGRQSTVMGEGSPISDFTITMNYESVSFIDAIIAIHIGKHKQTYGVPVASVKKGTETVYTVPEQIRTLKAHAIEGYTPVDVYGLALSDTVYNYLDLANKQYVINCASSIDENNGIAIVPYRKTIDVSAYISDEDGEITVSAGDRISFCDNDGILVPYDVPNAITYYIKKGV